MVVYLRSGKETSYLIVRLAPNYNLKISIKQYKKGKEVIKVRYLVNNNKGLFRVLKSRKCNDYIINLPSESFKALKTLGNLYQL